ncbi:MAG: hypothetical protein LUJ25_01035 [Firmicutes bacterium]|nr:hypothetical protein [Bacillota bacterium]
MSATRSLEERLLEMEKKEQASREKAKRYAEKKKVLQQRQAEDERNGYFSFYCQNHWQE